MAAESKTEEEDTSRGRTLTLLINYLEELFCLAEGCAGSGIRMRESLLLQSAAASPVQCPVCLSVACSDQRPLLELQELNQKKPETRRKERIKKEKNNEGDLLSVISTERFLHFLLSAERPRQHRSSSSRSAGCFRGRGGLNPSQSQP